MHILDFYAINPVRATGVQPGTQGQQGGTQAVRGWWGQIVADLRTLRTLGEQLMHFDAVTFLEYLEALRVTEGTGAHWLFHDAAHAIFDQARKRVYVVKAGARAPKRGREDPGPAPAAVPSVLEPILEAPPKWELLMDILKVPCRGFSSQTSSLIWLLVMLTDALRPSRIRLPNSAALCLLRLSA